MGILLNPGFWLALMLIGAAALVGAVVMKKTELLNSTTFAVGVSLLICLAFFSLLNHYLMDFQGLDYWYLFRK